jgi:hypothetical protein
MLCCGCGADVPEGSASCANCGSPVLASASAPPPRVTPPQGALPPPAQLPTEGKATASLVLGVLSLLCLSILGGVPAVILGHVAQSNIRKSAGQLGGQGMALAGLIMGYLSIVLFVLMMAATATYFIQARISANEDTAILSLRKIKAVQVVFEAKHRNRGYARELATLGPGPDGSCPVGKTEDHACMLDNALGCSSTWCARSGYKFNVTGTECGEDGVCKGYVVVAVPISGSMGRRSFCSL